MLKQNYRVSIDAPREKVWQVLWGEDTYPAWTKPFSESSNVKTTWEKGSRVLFTDGKGDGMISTIEEKIPNEFMSFRHLGMIENGVEDTTSEKIKGWVGALENYRLNENNGKTELEVEQDVTEEHSNYFEKAWPLALTKVKELSEA